MSYNYLPLDRKRLHFQQVKNLLDFDQLVSITFDAHERILQCRSYLESGADAEKIETLQAQNSAQLQNGIENAAHSGAEEVPVEVVKLMLMLKIKSLSHGHSGIHIDTVKRQMELYNNNVLPVVYIPSVSQAEKINPLVQLSLPLVGLGEVNYNGQKRATFSVFEELNWQPLTLQPFEAQALISGTHFMSAYGMFALKKTAQLLNIANLVAAASSQAYGCGGLFCKKMHATKRRKGEADTAAVIERYLQGVAAAVPAVSNNQDVSAFAQVVSVHGAAKDTFNHVLSIFLDEVNGVTENPTIFPDEQLVQYTSEVDPYPLLLALSFLSTAVNGLGELSAARVKLLVNEQKLTAETTGDAETILATIAGDARPLLSLTMLGDLSTGGHQHAIDTAVLVPTGALQLVENVEKVFALELLVAMQTLTVGTRYEGSASIQQLVQDFTQQVRPANKAHLTNDNMLHAIRFIQSYAI